MKIKTTIRGGSMTTTAVATPVVIANPRRFCTTAITGRPVLTTAVALA